MDGNLSPNYYLPVVTLNLLNILSPCMYTGPIFISRKVANTIAVGPTVCYYVDISTGRPPLAHTDTHIGTNTHTQAQTHTHTHTQAQTQTQTQTES